jgi:hypothetical protein
MVKGTGSTYTKVVDIKDYPDLLAPRENVETTTLTDAARTYIPGLQNVDGSMDFTANYDMAAITALEALQNEQKEYAVWFGGTEVAGSDPTPSGDLGKFGGKGVLSYTVSGKGVNDVREIVVHITPSSPWARITD